MNHRSWLVAGLLLAAGCGKSPGAYTSAAVSETESSAAVAKADGLWAQRLDEAKLEESIRAYEAALAEEGPSLHVLQRLVRAWYFWGDAFTDDKDVQIERYEKAIEYGKQCLGTNEAFAAAIEGGEKEKDAVVHAKADDVPCLYWTATALGKWGVAMGISRTLKHIPTVKAYMTKVQELDGTYYNHGPDRYWGAYYAKLPSFAGRDFEQSATHLAASIEGAPHYLPTRVIRAADLAVGTGDLAMFDEDILHVLAANPNQVPAADVMPENVRDMEKARALWAKRSELFDKDTLAAAGPAPELPDPYQAPMAEETEMATDDASETEGQSAGASEAGTEMPADDDQD